MDDNLTLGCELTEIGRFHKLPDELQHDTLLKQYVKYFQEETVLNPTIRVIDEHKKRISEMVQILKNLEDKEEKITKLWNKTKKWSIDEFKNIYKWLNIDFDHDIFESEFSESSKKLVHYYLNKKIFKKSDGCIGADLSDHGLGFLILIKSDGSGLYATKDLILAKEKFSKWNIDKSIYVVDVGQTLHFKQVFETLGLMGYQNIKQNSVHVSYEQVVLPSGKMSSRTGSIIVFSKLKNQLQAQLYKNFYDQKIKEKSLNEELDALANGIIKYGMLNKDIGKEITFSLDEWINKTGNTGVYIMYQYARIASILREIPMPNGAIVDYSLLKSDKEKIILSNVSKFWYVLEDCTKTNNPAILCRYLYNVCHIFSSWYIEKDQETGKYINNIKNTKDINLKKTRLMKIKCIKQCIKTGLYLLGIDALEKIN